MSPGPGSFPDASIKGIVDTLCGRFGSENVRYVPQKLAIAVRLQFPEGDTTVLLLTRSQAKYLCDQPLSTEDLRFGRFPDDWPRE
jgi:hypothetical protein